MKIVFVPFLAALVLGSFLFCGDAGARTNYPNRPKLILTLVIDQFRADYLTRFETRFLPAKSPDGKLGGFRYLMETGAYYPFAQYDILHSATGPGHATILTGAYPYKSGIPLNYWFDSEQRTKIYCTEDPGVQLVGGSSAKGGQSPRNLFATTVGDELKNAGLPSRVVSIALKDRAAILMGGRRADLAFWFDNSTTGWSSSGYYLPNGKLPDWLERLNREVQARKGEKYVWNPAGVPTGFSAPDALDYQPTLTSLGKAFPHQASFGTRESFALPLGLELLETAAERAIGAMGLGKGKSTDLLAISFSNHDYLAHAFGPNSLEMEEMTVAEDRIFSKLLNHVQNNVPGGLKNVVIVLTADHGAPLSPEWMKAHQMDAGRIPEKEIVAKVNRSLNEKFGKPESGDWVAFEYDLEIFLNEKAVQRVIQEKRIDRARLEAEAKAAILGSPGVSYVFTRSEYSERRLPPLMHERQALKTYFPGRSGDLIMIGRPYWTIESEDPVEHMTGYNYDRTVPLIVAGMNVRAGVYPSLVQVVDIAPTLTFLAGVMLPSVSEGRILSEALNYAVAP